MNKYEIDIVRLLTGISLMLICFIPWHGDNWMQELNANVSITVYVLGFLSAIALITHIIRRLLFPYLDAKKYAEKALQEPMSAALVFASMVAVICTLIVTSSSFFSR